MKRAMFIIAVCAFTTAPVMADLFFDDFNSEHGGVGILNYTGFANWTVTEGTVDLIGNGYFDWFNYAHGLYVDMDGSTGNAGTMETKTSLALDPGTYVLSFDLAGNHRNDASEMVTVNVSLGAFSQNYSLSRNAPFTTYTETFTVATAGNYDLSFAGAGGDNIGMLLDNVSVNVVPLPGAILLGMLGLSVAGVRLRKHA